MSGYLAPQEPTDITPGHVGTAGSTRPAVRLGALPRRRRVQRSLAVGALAASLVLAACGDDDPASTATTTTADGGSSSSAPSTDPDGSTSTTTDIATEQAVRIYLTRGEDVASTSREVSGPGLAQAALEALFAGPNSTESTLGMGSEVPDGTALNSVDIADGVATVDLTESFQSGGGSLSMQLRVAQIVFTLTQFDTVDTVDIRIDGSEVEGIGGEGIPASDLDRAEFEDVSPAILVESPHPGATVTSPVTISGTSNTFEATYMWAVLGDDGMIWEQGFGTATSGTGTRGTFSVDVELGDHSGPATIKVYESSAKDGSEVNVVTIPVTVG